MRFAKLSLERYGHFEGCELSFRDAPTDLHVVYGPNEAGKSTSLAAVSDLLFGFPARSPYNFRFDYSLLRVGATLEDEGVSLACRRRKSGSATLVDGGDKALDEGMLLAMLRGQTRDTFRLSFSLDQDALRRGGQAMVDARDNVGQALFAAGSGLTGVAEELRRIEDEAEAIWGKRAKVSRSYTQAERELEASLRAIRDDGLKPKEWADTRKMLESAGEKLAALEGERDGLQLERSKSERVRRIAGSVRLRADLLTRLAGDAAPIELAAHVEAVAEAAIGDAEAATRQLAIMDKLLQELTERARPLVADPVVLDNADAIDALMVESGAVAKDAKDLERLEPDYNRAEADLVNLQVTAGTAAGTSLSAVTIAALRDMARAHAGDMAVLAQINDHRIDLDERRLALAAGLERQIADASLTDLTDAVDAARRLGADTDNRCVKARKAADGAAREVDLALARLQPWTGAIAALCALPTVSLAEIAAVKASWAELGKALDDEKTEARRHQQDAAKIELQIAALPTGSVVSEEKLAEGRAVRSGEWAAIRAHIVAAAPLADPRSAADRMEVAIADVDDLADRRFALADASGRLAGLKARRAAHRLDAEQAGERAAATIAALDALRRSWDARVESLRLPPLEPVQLETWLVGRAAALAAEAERARLADEADDLQGRRAAVIARLRTQLGEQAPADNLADILARAERARSLRESKVEQARADRLQLAQIDTDIAAQEKKRGLIAARTATLAGTWTQTLGGSGIAVNIAAADGPLTAIDTMRQSLEVVEGLKRRIERIRSDAKQYRSDLATLAEKLGSPQSDDPERLLQAMKARLQQGQATKQLRDQIAADHARRTTERDIAAATHDAATAVLAPVYQETGTTEPSGLSAAIERSRSMRRDRASLADMESQIVREGDGLALDELVATVEESDPDLLLARTGTLARELATLNTAIVQAATSHGDARRAFDNLAGNPAAAASAASDAEQARAEMAVQAEAYILKRAQAMTLRWAIEAYRQRHQDPMLVRASELFSTLTLGRYSALRIELDGAAPRLIGITGDGRTAVDVTGMSEGTTDQLFLSLRLAAVEQSVAAGIRLPFLADDLFVNFDDERSAAGFRVLAELAQKTQVLFFTHHIHLAKIARAVVGETAYSECALA